MDTDEVAVDGVLAVEVVLAGPGLGECAGRGVEAEGLVELEDGVD